MRPDLLAGAAVSHVRGELDTETTGGGTRVQGAHETTVTSVHPYVAWLPSDGPTLASAMDR